MGGRGLDASDTGYGKVGGWCKMDLQEVGAWTGSSWLRIGTCGRHL